MSDSESVDYLQPGFDPASLTNPRLRSILVTYNVHYASNAKKPELVELFNTHVAPQASKILARRARAKRSSMGIIDATGGGVSSAGFGDDDDYDRPPAPLSPRKRRPQRAQTPLVNEDAAEADDSARTQRRSSPRKRSSRSASFQPVGAAAGASGSDSEQPPLEATVSTTARPPSRRARAKTPQVKLEPPEEASWVAATPVAAHSLHRPRGRLSDEDSAFTDDNPFQSGSSPLSGASPTAHRRRTADYEPAPTPHRLSNGAVPKKTPLPQASRAVSSPAVQAVAAAQRRVTPFSRVMSASASPRPESDDDVKEEEDEDEGHYVDDGYDPLAPGEEFTPDEQLEMAQEEAAGRHSSMRARADKPQRATRGIASALTTPLWVLFLTLLGAYGAWYRREKLAVGFCGLGRPAVPLLADQVDWLYSQDWLPDAVRDWELPERLRVFVEPQCEPCPAFAVCYSDFTVRCESGFREKKHPLSLGGLVPLPPTCESDGERARRVKAVADKAIEELRDIRAKWECDDPVDDDSSSGKSSSARNTPNTGSDSAVDGPSILAPLLKQAIGAKRSKRMTNDEFDDLWTDALGDIMARDEVEVEEAEPTYAAAGSGSLPGPRLSSTSLANLPLRCAIRRSIRLGLARYRLPLSLLILTLLGAAYVRARFRARRAMLARVPALVDTVLERLAAQKELWLYEDDVDGEPTGGSGSDGPDGLDGDDFRPDPFLFLPHLRDDVLRSTHSLAKRERIWEHVRAVVEQNSNVRTGVRTSRNGEVGRAWEWIGPVGTAPSIIAASSGMGMGAGALDMSAARRRRSGRASIGPAGRASGRGSGAGSAASWTTPVETPTPAAPAVTAAPTNVRGEDTDKNGENRSALHRRWQESRPIY